MVKLLTSVKKRCLRKKFSSFVSLILLILKLTQLS